MNVITSIIGWFGQILGIYDFNVNMGDFTVNFKSIIIFIFMLNALLLVFKVILKARINDNKH